MVWLQTLGSPVLYDDERAPIGGAGGHRRTIGLLSVLVVAGDGGMTRDKLAGLFWPDFEQKRARHSVTQALYTARKAAGHEDLFEANEDVRLNFARIGSDLREFEDRLSQGDDEGAVELYRGPFLDGFYLRSPEFDMWLTQERTRIEALAISALDRLINRFENEGDIAKALVYARRKATLRPTDGNAVIYVMRLLSATGDRPAALEEARRYAAILREHYDMAPDSAVVDFTKEILAEGPDEVLPDIVRTGRLTPSPAKVFSAAEPSTRSSKRTRSWLGPVALVVVLLAVTGILLQREQRSGPVVLTPLEQRTMIAPFRVNTSDAQLGYLSDGLIELLATRLADDSADRAMDAGAMIRAWRGARISSTNNGLDVILPVAAKLNAKRIVVGSVVGIPSRISISASVVDVATQRALAQANVEGSTDTLAALVDGLARRLLLAQSEPDEALADRMTESLPALRDYLRGTAAYARGDYALSETFYGNALKRDSAFALAAIKLGMAAGRMADFEAQRIAFDQAWRTQTNLGSKDRAFILAQLGPRYPLPSPLRDVIAAWNRAARLAPERPEVWTGLAMALQEFRTTQHVGDSDAIIAALSRAIELDPAYVSANVLFRRLTGDYTDQRTAWRDSIRILGPARLRSVALTSQYNRFGTSEADSALRFLLGKAADADDALTLLTGLHSSALSRGDAPEALELTRRMQRIRPAGRAHLRLRILDALYSTHDSASADQAARELQALTSSDVPAAAADNCVLAQWHIWRGDFKSAGKLADKLDTQPPETPILAGAQPQVCASLVRAQLSVNTHADDAADRLKTFESYAFLNSGFGDLTAYANIAAAELHRKLTGAADALSAIRRRPEGALVWPRYLESSIAIEKSLCETVGTADDPSCVALR
jgi:DNA-binding SARP family transcriptional activator/tetratricopeptide (TPR) repeat protein